jgi:hypothetical protein
MVRAMIQYEREPDPERYARHLEEFTRPVACDAFRHGKVFGSPFGDPPYAYVAEFEWADMDGFNAAVRSDEFAAAGKDAMEMGIPFTVAFSELTEWRSRTSPVRCRRTSSASSGSSTRRTTRGRR